MLAIKHKFVQNKFDEQLLPNLSPAFVMLSYSLHGHSQKYHGLPTSGIVPFFFSFWRYSCTWRYSQKCCAIILTIEAKLPEFYSVLWYLYMNE